MKKESVKKPKWMEPNAKFANEQTFRRRIVNMARNFGGDTAAQDVLNILAKYDNLLRNCTNEQEKLAIGQLGSVEIHKYFGMHGGLTINGQIVIPDENS